MFPSDHYRIKERKLELRMYFILISFDLYVKELTRIYCLYRWKFLVKRLIQYIYIIKWCEKCQSHRISTKLRVNYDASLAHLSLTKGVKITNALTSGIKAVL